MGQYCPDAVWAGYREWAHTFADVVRPKLAGLVADGFKVGKRMSADPTVV